MIETNMDRLAVLIDADNSMPGVIDELLKETTKYGRPIIKRAYGDWTTPHLQSWKKVLHKHAIMPRQQFNYTIGKNSTDCALIIDAMDLLYSKNLTGFCIVSSDSDFTGLATRIRQDGLSVYGFGERKTPGAFVAACDKFIFLEVLKCTHGENQPPTETADHKSTDFCGTIAEAINVVARDDGWATLAAVGDHISKNDPSFDPRNFGYRKLGELVAAVEFVETKYEEIGEHKHMYVKLKELKP